MSTSAEGGSDSVAWIRSHDIVRVVSIRKNVNINKVRNIVTVIQHRHGIMDT